MNKTEYTLDPHQWGEMRQLGHRMLDDMMDYLEHIRERKVWTEPDTAVKEAMTRPLPLVPQSAGSVYDEFRQFVLPYNASNVHPRFWGWVMGGGTPFGMLADMLASAMNTNVSIGDSSAMYVERQVLDWSKQMMGYPASASGILTSGASMANITAMIVARNSFDKRIKQQGLRIVPAQMVVYGSSETHNCVIKGIEAIGVGGENFRKIPVDENFRIRLDILEATIAQDRAAGLLPFCIIGNAGTVNTGAIDDLTSLAAIAKWEGLWFHIDGAFGAVPRILASGKIREQLNGLELSDSISFDFHKWFYVNYEVGCLLVKDAAIHKAAFSYNVNYLVTHERGLSGGPDPFANYGIELSRGFKALKVWMLLKEHGVNEYARQVQQNLDQAAYLGELVKQQPELELLTEVSMNIVCYRYRAAAGQDPNPLNKELLMRMHEEGIAAPSYTILNGQYAIRVAITNHRSRRADFEALIEASIRIGKEICKK